jgi:hypothetical protein
MKAVRIFNLLHVLGNKISVSDIDEFKIFKFYENHEIRPRIEVMKSEVIKYQTLVVMTSPMTLYHSLSPIPNTLYRCIRLYIKNQHGRVGRVFPFGNTRRHLN